MLSPTRRSRFIEMDIHAKKTDQRIIGAKRPNFGGSDPQYLASSYGSSLAPQTLGNCIVNWSVDLLMRDAKSLSDLIIRIGGCHTAGRRHDVVSDPCEHCSHVGGKKRQLTAMRIGFDIVEYLIDLG